MPVRCYGIVTKYRSGYARIYVITLDQQQFRFSYDAANRMLAADHKTHNGTSWQNTDRYKESGIGYDLNGNIKTYIRDGWLSGSTYGNIDFLTYTYDTNIPDRLVKVVDNGSQTKGFKYLPNLLGNHYFYDNNGNLTQDRHKNLNFDYNYLNLPDSIFVTGGSYMSITYTADGEKLTKISPAGTRNYVAGIEYLGTCLEAIYHAEGRCTVNVKHPCAHGYLPHQPSDKPPPAPASALASVAKTTVKPLSQFTKAEFSPP